MSLGSDYLIWCGDVVLLGVDEQRRHDERCQQQHGAPEERDVVAVDQGVRPELLDVGRRLDMWSAR